MLTMLLYVPLFLLFSIAGPLASTTPMKLNVEFGCGASFFPRRSCCNTYITEVSISNQYMKILLFKVIVFMIALLDSNEVAKFMVNSIILLS